VSDATNSLLFRFAGKLESSGYVVTPGTQDDELVVAKDGHHLVLLFSKTQLERELRTGEEDAQIVWGPGVTVEESLARFMTIHLDESLATTTDHNIDGRWRYTGSFFAR
jgi:hypothetical protein